MGQNLFRVQELSEDLRATSKSRRLVLTALFFLTGAGCVARMLIDANYFGDPVLASVVLVAAWLFLSLLAGFAVGLLVILLLPALFGAAPWDSPVRAALSGTDFPVYLFDVIISFMAIFSIFLGLAKQHRILNGFLKENWWILLVVVFVMVSKIVAGGITGNTLRNAALFYYFLAIGALMFMLQRYLDVKTIVPWVMLRVLPLIAIAPLLVLIGIAVGARDAVLVSIHQGMVEPISPLVWLPPGSLILLCFCAAAFLFDSRTSTMWKVVLVVLLIFDYVTYFNRAMWVGIAIGIFIPWVMHRGIRRSIVPVSIGLIGLAIAFGALRSFVKEGHHESSEWRLLAWTLTASNIIKKPLIGHSYSEPLLDQVLASEGSWRVMDDADMVISPQARSPHNSYLSLLFFGGLLQGGAVLFFILVTLGRLAVRTRRLAKIGRRNHVAEAVFRGAIAVVVYAGFNVVLETPIEGITYWIVIYVAWLWAWECNRARPVLV